MRDSTLTPSNASSFQLVKNWRCFSSCYTYAYELLMVTSTMASLLLLLLPLAWCIAQSLFTASFEPKGGEVAIGEATTCVIAAAPPSTATSSCLCYLWVLWTRTRDEDAIPFDLLTSASNLSATTAFTFHLEFQRRRTNKKKKFSFARHHYKAQRRNSLCNIVLVASPSAIAIKLADADCSVAPWSSRCHLPLLQSSWMRIVL